MIKHGFKKGLYKHSEETKIIMRKPKLTTINMKHPKSEEHKKNLSESIKRAYAEGKLNTSGNNNGMYGKVPWNKGIKRTDEEKKKISETKLRNYVEGKTISWNKGIPMREESKIKLSISKKGVPNTKVSETLKERFASGELKPIWLGRHHNEKSIIKQSETKLRLYKEGKLVAHNKGKHLKESTKNKLRIAHKGKYHTKETCKKMSLSRIGEKNPSWLGGKSFEPYGLEFNRYLKEDVRKRDNYMCQECNKNQEELKRKLYIHHIDYNKKNNKEFNLISLCLRCHLKTNTNREHWKNYYKMKIFFKELFNPQNILVFNNNKLISMEKLR